MRLFTTVTGCLAAGFCLAQEQLVLTRILQEATIEQEAVLHLDLEDFFQFYNNPGPVATFVIDMPELDGRNISIPSQGGSTSIVTYRLKNGNIYNDPYSVGGSDYVWNRHNVEFQLKAAEVPLTVANFMTYVADGEYENTIVHRNESTGSIFRPSASGGSWAGYTFKPFQIIQSGAFRLYHTDQYILETIVPNKAIPLEAIGHLGQGSLAMARGNTLDSATSQFFVNLYDNSFIVSDPHVVFGELMEPMEDLPILMDFADAPVYDLTSPYTDGAENFFPNLPFNAIPLYAPFPFEKESYARITSIEIPRGNPDGVSYSYEWLVAGDEPTAEELHNQKAFTVELAGASLRITRRNTGRCTLRVTGSGTDGQESHFDIDLTAYNSEAFEIFSSGEVYPEGWMYDSWYGWLIADEYPNIYHQNHRHQFVADGSTEESLYLYDLSLATWLYTSPYIYPYIYHYGRKAWLWYQVGSGDYDSLRWFYLNTPDNPRWLTEEDI